MTFSDDDLKRLKDHISKWPEGDWRNCFIGDIRALLARLEAAEKIVEALPDIRPSIRMSALQDAWRKACGL